MNVRLRCFVAAFFFASLASAADARADAFAWQVPIYAQLPSAQGFDDQVLSAPAGEAPSLVIATTWVAPGYIDEIEHPRVVSIDASNGRRQWQRDLDEDCVTMPSGSQRAATFANGDMAVVAAGSRYVAGIRDYVACYARLDRRDGRILWSYRDRLAPGEKGALRVEAIGIGSDDDLYAIGNAGPIARVLRLAGADGALRWTRDIASADGSVRGAAIDAGAGTLLAIAETGDGGHIASREVTAMNEADGTVRWRRELSRENSSPGGSSLSRRADGSVIVRNVWEGPTGTATTSILRLSIEDGAQVWERRLSGYGLHGITASGDIAVQGEASLSGIAGDDGRLLWATPIPASDDGPDSSIGSTSFFTQSGLYVWEGISRKYQSAAESWRLSSYDLAGGRLQSRIAMPGPLPDYLYQYGRVHALPGGDALVSGFSLFATGGRWLWNARVKPATGEIVWSGRELVEAPQPVDFSLNNAIGSILQATLLGTPGIVVTGRAGGNSHNGEGYPYMAKLAQDDGRVLWTWQPEPIVPVFGRIEDVLTDPFGDLIVAGVAADESWESARLLAKVDPATGTTRWQHTFEGVERPLLASEERSGDVFVLTQEKLYRHSGRDGGVLWSVDFPVQDYWKTWVIAAATDGVFVAGSYTGNGSQADKSLRIAKFGGDGTRLWQRDFRSPAAGAGDLAVLPSGDAVLLGYDGSPFLARLSGASGDTLWRREVSMDKAMRIDRDGQIVLAGKVALQPERWGVARLDAATGTQLWSSVLDGIGANGSILQLSFDRADLLVAATGEKNTELRVARVALADGAFRWFAGKGGGLYQESPVGMAVGGDGSVFVAVPAEGGEMGDTANLFKFTGVPLQAGNAHRGRLPPMAPSYRRASAGGRGASQR